MSVTYPIDQEREEAQLKEHLKMELGWQEVANGLGKIVLGYVVWGVVLVVGGLIIVMAAYQGIKEGGVATGKIRPAILWQFWGGAGLVGFGSLFAWWTIICAKWKCLLHVPDRHMARWFLFFCFTCVLVGPVFNGLANLGFQQHPPKFQQGPLGFMDWRLTGMGNIILIIGFIVSLLQPMFFLLFLRAVAACLNARFMVTVMNLYLAGWGGMVAATGYLQFGPLMKSPKLYLTYLSVLAVIWLIWGLAYFGLILAVRSSITATLASWQAAQEREKTGTRRRW